ncbi:hypothetical protein [Thalassovita sp.]|uniref:hypothetical protein n=1 Tax=Thalassovita sp. TaxID=1979401 RepID=UPI002882340A|nr:hypothetical protein [Thalassovita sp.]MDF1801704.1 hypothetical protein [Thalassovita sp.]
MTHLERMNRNQIRRDHLRETGERLLWVLTWTTVIAGGAYVAALFIQTIDQLNRSW